MVAGGYRSDRRIFGRERERDRVVSAVRDAIGGRAQSVIVEGPSGMGKTSLIVDVRREIEKDRSVLWLHGTCLPLASLTIPFLGIRSALQSVSRDATVEGAHPPDVDSAPQRVAVLVDRWIEDVTRHRPLVLAIDDLQWADPDTLDTVLFLMGGPHDRPLAIVGTQRTDERSAITETWRAQLRRLPRLEMITLGPLDRAATAEQIASLTGRIPARTLVEDVHGRSRGHPYLTELLVEGLAPGATALPPHVPETVRSAVLGAVGLLPDGAQRLLQVLAVAARPLSPRDFGAVLLAGQAPVDAVTAEELLSEAARHGVITENGAEGFWFRHPLTPELIAAAMPVAELRRWHSVLAAYEAAETDSGSTFDRAVRIAVHQELSGSAADALAASMDAAEEAHRRQAFAQELRFLRRALGLASLDDPRRPGLVDRARLAARAAAATDIESEMLDELLAGDLPELQRAELLHRRLRLRLVTQRGPVDRREYEELLRITEHYPESPAHAKALASWAATSLDFLDAVEPRHADAADAAMAVARAAGDAGALAHTLTIAAYFRYAAGDLAGAGSLATEALPAALSSEDWVAFNSATGLVGAVRGPSAHACATETHRQREELVARGAPHVYVSWLASDEAALWLLAGSVDRCREALRYVAVRDPGPYSDASARITAARLTALQGRADDAAGQLEPVLELLPAHPNLALLPLDVVRAETWLAGGSTEHALAAAREGLARPALSDMAEWLLPLAARALADRVGMIRRSGGDPSGPLADLGRLREENPAPVVPPVHRPWAREWASAFQLLYDGEFARADADPSESRTWARAAEALGQLCLPWEEAYALLRTAQAVLRHAVGNEGRAAARRAILRGRALAADLHAEHWAAEFARLAALVHLSEASAAPRPDRDGVSHPNRAVGNPRLASLTAREREVIALIAVGRTYGEVANELFISEKTVSAHVSHVLAKTGAANRAELAWLWLDEVTDAP